MRDEPYPFEPMGTTAWIIGASSGLGLAMAQQLHQQGVTVVLSGRRADLLQNAVNGMRRWPEAHACPMDITDPTSIEQVFSHIHETWGLPNLIMVCAGQFLAEEDGVVDVGDLERLWKVNVLGPQRVLNAVFEVLRTTPQHPYKPNLGQVVVVGSLIAHAPTPTAAAYGATKAALEHLVLGQHAAWWKEGLLLQLALPGFIDTPMMAHGRYPAVFGLSADQAAQRLLRAMRSRKAVLTFPRRAAILARVAQWLPTSWRLRLMARRLASRRPAKTQ